MPDILKFVQVCERRITKRERREDPSYFDALDALLDQIFDIAEEQEMTWGDLAAKAGLARQTIVNLGERITRRPQFRTVLHVAGAVERKLTLQVIQAKGHKKTKLKLRRA